MSEYKPMVKRQPTKSQRINRWTDLEEKKLIQEYKAGRSRNEIAPILSRTSGSVAGKIRLLIQSGVLPGRR